MGKEHYVLDKIEMENYKKFKSFVLVVNGENLSITGHTGQGKTTVITSLWELLEMVGEPITTGETAGRLRITLKDSSGSDKKVFAERRFTAKTKNIAIVDSEGNKIKAKEFKDWFCALAVNPQKLKDKKPLELMETLLECVEFQSRESYDSTVKQLATDVEDRKTSKEDLAILERNLGQKPEEVKAVSIEDASAALTKEQELEKTYNETKENVTKADERLVTITTRKAELAKELENLEAEEAKLENWKPATIKWLEDTVVDVAGKQEALFNISASNEKATAFAKWIEDEKNIAGKKEHLRLREESIKNLRGMLKKTLELAEWPLPGLCIEDGQVYYNHVPFEQVGDSKKMLICSALAATQIQDKPIRVVRMDGTESMSKEDFNTVINLFNAKGIQVLSTRVSRDGETEPGELIIHDGGVL